MIKNVSYFGQIIDKIFFKQYIYIVCNDKGIYSLLKYYKSFDNCQILLRCSDITYIEELIKNELKQ